MWAQDSNSLAATSPHPLPDRISTPRVYLMQLSMLCLGGGGGEGGFWEWARDEVGTLIRCTHPTWGILAKFEQKGWPQDRKAWAMQKAVGPTVREFEPHSKISSPLVGNVWWQKPPDFECGGFTYEFFAILKIPKIPRILNVLSRCKKMEERKVKLLMFILKFVPLTTVGPFYWCDCKQILSDNLQQKEQ